MSNKELMVGVIEDLEQPGGAQARPIDWDRKPRGGAAHRGGARRRADGRARGAAHLRGALEQHGRFLPHVSRRGVASPEAAPSRCASFVFPLPRGVLHHATAVDEPRLRGARGADWLPALTARRALRPSAAAARRVQRRRLAGGRARPRPRRRRASRSSTPIAAISASTTRIRALPSSRRDDFSLSARPHPSDIVDEPALRSILSLSGRSLLGRKRAGLRRSALRKRWILCLPRARAPPGSRPLPRGRSTSCTRACPPSRTSAAWERSCCRSRFRWARWRSSRVANTEADAIVDVSLPLATALQVVNDLLNLIEDHAGGRPSQLLHRLYRTGAIGPESSPGAVRTALLAGDAIEQACSWSATEIVRRGGDRERHGARISRRSGPRAGHIAREGADDRDGQLPPGGVMSGYSISRSRGAATCAAILFVGLVARLAELPARETALQIVEVGAGAFGTLHLTGGEPFDVEPSST